MEDAAIGWTGRADNDDAQQLSGLRDKRILYVGGRPSSNVTLKALVESHGGRMTIHDGGIEDRKGMLPAALPNVDVVIFPVDCIGHDAMHTLKRLCERYQIAFHPVRTASVASFVQLAGQIFPPVGPEAEADVSRPPPSRFCLRHG